MVLDKMVLDKMAWTKWYTDKMVLDKMVLDKMVWTKWYTNKMVYRQNGIGQNGTDKIISQSIPLPLTAQFFYQSRFHFDPFRFPLCVYHLFVFEYQLNPYKKKLPFSPYYFVSSPVERVEKLMQKERHDVKVSGIHVHWFLLHSCWAYLIR